MNAKRIAVIGGGIAGLTAGYLLSRRHQVTLFEKSGRVGGNAFSLKTSDGAEPDIAVAAFGMAGYKNFYSLLAELGVDTRVCPNSYMSMHDMDSGAGLYLTPSLKGGLAQRFDMLKPAVIRSVFSLFTGLKRMQEQCGGGGLHGRTFAEALASAPEIRGDARLILLCTLCLMSSMDPSEVLATPAEFFLAKLRVHHDVISPKALYSVRCVDGGTRRYVAALASRINGSIQLGSDIRTVRRSPEGVTLVHGDGRLEKFDDVVMACNADQALRLLEEPSADERRVLGAWKYKEGRVVVHRDHSAFPPRNLIQAYTYLYRQRGNHLETSVNGALWHEPHVPDSCELISAQHPNYPIRDKLIEFETTLRTPVFDFVSVRLQKDLPGLNGILNTWYCGSHFGYGLHDDAVSSAIRVADRLGVPYQVAPVSLGGSLKGFLARSVRLPKSS